MTVANNGEPLLSLPEMTALTLIAQGGGSDEKTKSEVFGYLSPFAKKVAKVLILRQTAKPDPRNLDDATRAVVNYFTKR